MLQNGLRTVKITMPLYCTTIDSGCNAHAKNSKIFMDFFSIERVWAVGKIIPPSVKIYFIC